MSNTRLDTKGDIEKLTGGQGTHTNDPTETLVRKAKGPPYKNVSGNNSIDQACTKIGAPKNGLTPQQRRCKMKDVSADGEGTAAFPDMTMLTTSSTRPATFADKFCVALAALCLKGEMARRVAANEDNVAEADSMDKELVTDMYASAKVRRPTRRSRRSRSFERSSRAGGRLDAVGRGAGAHVQRLEGRARSQRLYHSHTSCHSNPP